ncbi:hypothetical protein [Bradyrhizobium sp. cf659]|uniref:hypothetical protein n=1 Tax=Bradyrhizobium sp. cf659 TaxID=1761771 RepID=UPI0008E5DBD8|nr:hypothetical protein [Bradyrhizobium sp. cf659]SFI21488.1 hypothetical protein SAMN04487925_102265 [Bradyrhizobium sp. cf659]
MPPSAGDHHRLLYAWQLAVLRFAVTLSDSDRLNVAAPATELDRLGGRRSGEDSLHFFRRTTSRLCAAICGQQQDAEATLNCFRKQIDQPRLRLAFAAAVGLARSKPARSKPQPKRSLGLFRGLPARPASL